MHDLCLSDNFIRHRHCFLLLEGFTGQPPTYRGYEHQKFMIFGNNLENPLNSLIDPLDPRVAAN